ncbi:hypothetical protein PHLGIDRAFT_256692 [Phlebiopsis gigantea 11061_1 CR5-6]|uniref:F-box domain-containing protein n=1 Tax=Phlebiopsis gigantea (strain 11061_1 CR5-6) TaxID=745531 RepID=A0A0C3RS23_PHLG1|nr:hypothetical protein PHLGIDRAFT_256692 [Phlebiopsis gigantea 11061_1 CR5-6]
MAKDKNIESKWHSDLDVLLGGWNTSSVDWAKVREDVIEVARTKYDRASFVEIGLEDICHQVLDQLSARLSPMLWARLPGEIVDYVIDCILPSLTQQSNSKLKRIISALSLVCKRWAAHCRPFLFHRLILIRLADPYYLHTILASPTSGWLGEHIQTITFKQVGSMSNPESSQSLCVNELPNVSRISYAYQNRTGGNGPIVPLSLRIIWGNMYLPLTSLQLETYRFRSVSVLLRTLGALRYLEDVQLYRVSWTVESNPDAMLQCKAGFSSIRRVRVTECQEGWPFAWLFAAASMGHTFKFLRRGEETTVPKDVMAIVRLCRTFSDPNYRSTIIQRQEPPSEYAFYYSLAHGDGDHSPRYEYELAFVAKPIKPLTGPDDLAQPTRLVRLEDSGHDPGGHAPSVCCPRTLRLDPAVGSSRRSIDIPGAAHASNNSARSSYFKPRRCDYARAGAV